LYEEPLEDGVVQVRRANDEPLAAGAHADRNVSGGNIGRRARGGDAGLLAPPLDHLSNPDNAAYVIGFSRWHFSWESDGKSGKVSMSEIETDQFEGNKIPEVYLYMGMEWKSALGVGDNYEILPVVHPISEAMC
jgi:hypothetical protein